MSILGVYTQRKKREDDARRKAELMATTQASNSAADAAKRDEQASTLEKLKRLGIDTHGESCMWIDRVDVTVSAQW